MDSLCLPGMSGCVLRHIRDARPLCPSPPLTCKRGLPSSHSTRSLYASGTRNILRTITLLRMFSFRCAVPPGQALTPALTAPTTAAACRRRRVCWGSVPSRVLYRLPLPSPRSPDDCSLALSHMRKQSPEKLRNFPRSHSKQGSGSSGKQQKLCCFPSYPDPRVTTTGTIWAFRGTRGRTTLAEVENIRHDILTNCKISGLD